MNQELLEKYISGEASVIEREQVFLWAKSDDSNLKELQAMRKLHDITIWQRFSGQDIKRRNGKRLLFYRIAAVAAIFIILSGMGIYLFNQNQTPPEVVMQKIYVPAGQRVEMELIDGTKVWLNAGTTFIFPNNFNGDSRDVFLDGEAYFSVMKNNKKDFIVKTKSYDVNVTGTEFNLFAYAKSSLFEVALLEGGVEVYGSDKKERVRLEPSTRAYLSDAKLTKGKILNYDKLLWRTGLICFDDESTSDVIAKLELYFDIRIVVENNLFKTKKYTGKFRTKDGIEHILKVFQLKDKFVYEKNDDENIIIIR